MVDGQPCFNLLGCDRLALRGALVHQSSCCTSLIAHSAPSVCLQKGDQGCANCGDVPEAPVVAACAHVFCKQCLDLQVSAGRSCQLFAVPASQLSPSLCGHVHRWEVVHTVASGGTVCAPLGGYVLGPCKGFAQSSRGAASCLQCASGTIQPGCGKLAWCGQVQLTHRRPLCPPSAGYELRWATCIIASRH